MTAEPSDKRSSATSVDVGTPAPTGRANPPDRHRPKADGRGRKPRFPHSCDLLQAFAERHRLRLRVDECGEPIIEGLNGEIFEFDDGCLGLIFTPGRPYRWPYVRRKLIRRGFKIRQNGDQEGVATFCPADPEQTRLAITLVRARRKRNPSSAQLANLGVK